VQRAEKYNSIRVGKPLHDVGNAVELALPPSARWSHRVGRVSKLWEVNAPSIVHVSAGERIADVEAEADQAASAGVGKEQVEQLGVVS
jgi:hypothetical protein